MTAKTNRRSTRGIARAAAAALVAGACAAPATAIADETIEVPLACDSRTHCAGVLPDRTLIDCVAHDARWPCRTSDGRTAEVLDSAELNRQLDLAYPSGSTEATAPVVPKFKVKISIRARPTGA